jgi:hypothetical protein
LIIILIVIIAPAGIVVGILYQMSKYEIWSSPLNRWSEYPTALQESQKLRTAFLPGLFSANLKGFVPIPFQ